MFLTLACHQCFHLCLTLVATQVPVVEWHTRFPDPTIGDAILGRLIHNAYRSICKGNHAAGLILIYLFRPFENIIPVLVSLRSDSGRHDRNASTISSEYACVILST